MHPPPQRETMGLLFILALYLFGVTSRDSQEDFNISTLSAKKKESIQNMLVL